MRRSAAILVVVAVVAAACASAGQAQPETTASSPTQTVVSTRGATTAPTTPVPSGHPVARGYHQLLGLGDRGVWMFGGSTAGPRLGGRVLTDTWEYRGTAGWVQHGQATAPTSNGDAVGYDTASGRVVVLAFQGQSFETVSETWIYDVSADSWERRAPGAGPVAVHGVRAAYVPKSDRLIVLDEAGDTWAYDLDTDTWTNKAPPAHPPGRRYYAMAYDEGSDRVILFGGLGRADTWAYDPAANAWTEMTPPTSPSERLYHAMVYDSKSARMILFGGAVGPALAEQPLGDTWAYDYRTNTWTELKPQGAPTARGWHAMAYDAANGLVVLFGGGVDRGHFGADTWIYDPSRNTWSSPP